MAGKYEAKRRRRRRRLNPNFVLICLALLAALLFIVIRVAEGPKAPTTPTEGIEATDATEETKKGWFQKETEPPTEPPTEEPTAPTIVSTAKISATGDVLMHMPVVNTTKVSGGYDFTPIFQYLDDYAAAADYAVANLETTLAGLDNGYA